VRASIERLWWRAAPPPWPLQALEVLYSAVADRIARRRKATAVRLPVPVIVVGNVAVGGTGKTPVTLALIEQLRALGATPGVLSRGYGGRGPFPLLVSSATVAAHCGDEPLLIAQRAQVPLCVAPSRAEAGRVLLAAHPEVDVLLCDDGLQHYALARDLEIGVIDGARGHGNGHRLPAGPLREMPSRLDDCGLVLVNGAEPEGFGERALRFDLQADEAIELRTGESRALAAFVGASVEAVAGIGHPQRFFDLLQRHGLQVQAHAFADHHEFTAADLSLAGHAAIFMTEKDAVKCGALPLPTTRAYWYVPVTAGMSQAVQGRVQECLRSVLTTHRSATRPQPRAKP